MQAIRYFKLNQNGGFVARVQVICKSEQGTFKTELSAGIPSRQVYTLDLAEDVSIPEGSTVQLKISIPLGFGKTAAEQYVYQKDSTCTATYNLSGATVANSLKLTGLA